MDFAVNILTLCSDLQKNLKHFRLLDQLEAATSSIPQNIAEGKGRNSRKEFSQFLYIARGSAYETLPLLELFNRVNWIDDHTFASLELEGIEIIQMLKGLIDSLHKSF